MSERRLRAVTTLSLLVAVITAAGEVRAEDATPGYPERVVHWTTKSKETCADIASALYGSAKHKALLERYNSVSCANGKPLPDGLTLVLPAKVTDLPSARLRSIYPDVKARPPGGAWQEAASGMALYKNHSVNTLDKARADILFVDRTRVVLAEHTLVIIYGTAKNTAVSKTPPMVELDSGELQAGLAALRGKPIEVATQGGRVTANSRDTAVRAKEKRATVSVFDGTAKVASAKKSVDIPTNFGTAFVKDKAPEPPRPLPPGPKWQASTASGTVLGPPGALVLTAGWDGVDKARSYRVELAKDADFKELVAREEVPSEVRAFRAERLPPAAYFLRVRVIDTDDFLGLASETRRVVLAEARVEGSQGNIKGGVIELSPYASLGLGGFDGLELSMDDSPFGKVPNRIDVLRLTPKSIALRLRGSSESSRYEVRYREPGVSAQAKLDQAGTIHVSVALSGVDGVDVAGRMAPEARVSSAGKWLRQRLRAEGAVWVAELSGASAGSEPLNVQILDSRGRVLGETPVTPPGAPAKAALPSAPRRVLGPSAALVQPSPVTNVVWWAPVPDDAASVSATGYSEAGRFGSQLATRASGSLGSFGFDGLVTTSELDGVAADSAAWLTLHWRPISNDNVSLGPALQVGLPMTALSPPSRVGLGFAAGGFADRFQWLVNLGGRAPLEYSVDRRPAPDAQGYLLGGGGYEVNEWARLYAVVDGHAVVDTVDDAVVGRGGLTLGAEFGRRVFGGVALRASPWDDAGGHVIGQLALGLRAR
ncbi:MAG: FecR domain-containing protein [Myxococcales bacterium]|nr:FecR domain-containing protein [Myxococcales bacterium]